MYLLAGFALSKTFAECIMVPIYLYLTEYFLAGFALSKTFAECIMVLIYLYLTVYLLAGFALSKTFAALTKQIYSGQFSIVQPTKFKVQ